MTSADQLVGKLKFLSSILNPRFSILEFFYVDPRSSILDPRVLFAIKLLDETRGVQFFDQARINKCIRICGCGLWICARRIIEHGLDAVWGRVGNLRKSVRIIFVCSL